jgi:hypothetical protein
MNGGIYLGTLGKDITEIFKASKQQVNCVSKLLKNLSDNEEALCNIALYHLAVWMKINLRIICMRFSITYTDDESIEALFGKTEEYLPAHIVKMSNKIYSWYNEVQYESINIISVDEACDFARIIEVFFNTSVLNYAVEIRDKMQDAKDLVVNIKPLKLF